MCSHLPLVREKHQEKEFKANSTISKPCHVSCFKGMIEDSKQTSGDAKGRSYSEQTIIQSKVHIPGPSVGVSQIPRDKEATE